MEKLYKKLSDKLIKDLEIKSCEKSLDEPYLYFAKGKKQYTTREIIKDVKNQTPLGQKLVENLVLLALDLFDRKIENLENFENIKEEPPNRS